MNVIFHTITAISISVLIIDEDRHVNTRWLIVIAFMIGIIVHGFLDYIPHCYPINSKLDVILGLMIIIVFSWMIKKPYRLVVLFSFIGSVFPDIVDLLPAILNKYIGLHLPIYQKIFPWPEYSGSIYNKDCSISTLNHILLIVLLTTIFIFRWKEFKKMLYY